jgi:hypothetical protein
MKRSTATVSGVASMLVLAALALAWRESAPDQPPQPTAPDPSGATSRNAEAPTPAQELAALAAHDSADASVDPTEGFELPPPDVPLRDVFDSLDRMARRGHTLAACRVAAELMRCSRVHGATQRLRQEDARIRAMAQRQTSERFIEREIELIAAQRVIIEDATKVCAGFDLDSVPVPARYLAVAAQGGHVPSMIEYFSGSASNTSAFLRDPGLAEAYRRHGPVFFAAALESGDPALLQQWYRATQDPLYSVLAPMLPEPWRDPGFFHALADLLPPAQRDAVMPGYAQRLGRIEPTPEQRARAREVFDRHFARSSGVVLPNFPAGSSESLRHQLGHGKLRCDTP